MTFKLTAKQREALKLVNSKKKYVLFSGGSRSGKTFMFCHLLVVRALKCKSRHVILRFHFNDVKQSVGMDTLPKVLELMKVPYELNKSEWIFLLPNGSEIWIGGLDDKERSEKILGKEFSTIYLNEASQISYDSYQMALTRLAEKTILTNKVFVDCNPPTRDHWLYALFVAHKNPTARNMDIQHPELYGYFDINPMDNTENLPEGYIEEVLAGLDERQKARFRDGLWLDRREGALWSYDMIAGTRVESAPALTRIVVAIDPAVTANEDSDETGIVVTGIDSSGHIYVLEDSSMQGTPLQWGKAAISLYRKYHADRIVAEVNQGGDLVEANLRSIDKTIPYEQMRATRGKILRAEPVAALYEQGRVHHVGLMPELELQMTEFNPQSEDSPDRLDALVWGCTYLTQARSPIAHIPLITGGMKW